MFTLYTILTYITAYIYVAKSYISKVFMLSQSFDCIYRLLAYNDDIVGTHCILFIILEPAKHYLKAWHYLLANMHPACITVYIE